MIHPSRCKSIFTVADDRLVCELSQSTVRIFEKIKLFCSFIVAKGTVFSLCSLMDARPGWMQRESDRERSMIDQ
jgi:hypothetical protein